MVPTFEKFLYPSLLAYKDGTVKCIKEIKSFNISYLELSDEDCKELIKSGARTKVQDRTSFSITYLYQAGLLRKEKKGVYAISPEGIKLLNSGIISLTRNFLANEYPAFYDFAYNRKKETHSKDAQNPEDVLEELTPLEQMESAYELISKDLAGQILDEVKKQSPQFFESLVVKLLVAMGYGGSENDALVTKFSHDDGIDGIIKEDKLGLDSIYVQAKRYTTGSVQKPDMQKFIGALSEQGATKGIFITTSTFSSGAIETSKKASHIKIVLIDGKQLADYMIQYNVGVSVKQVYEIKKIDTDFFAEEE